MAHTILYPEDHKKAGQRKAAKDLTEGEQQTVADQKRLFEGRRRFHAQAVVDRLTDAEGVLSEDAV